MEERRATLSKTLSKLDIFGLAFGAMIGWGWVVFAGEWIRMAGAVGSSVAFIIGALMCVSVSLVYAEMTAALPVAGGPVAFSYRGLGETWSWITGWTMTLSYISVAAFESVAVTAAIDFVVPLPKLVPLWNVCGETIYLTWGLVGMTLSILITWLNLKGARISSKAQSVATALLLACGVFFVVVSSLKGAPANFRPLWVSISGTASVLMMVPFMMVGFDVIPQSAEEASISRGMVGRMLVISVVAATVWYLAIVMGLGYAIPPEARDASRLAVCRAVEILLGSSFWGRLLALGGVCGILTSWNAFLLAASRVLFSMGRARMLPPNLADINPTTGTPTKAVLIVGTICAIAPFFGPRALTWLANVGGMCTCITYFIVSRSFIVLRKTEPTLPRPFRAGKGRFVGVASQVFTLFFISLYLPIGPSSLEWPYEWAITALWALAGFLCYRASKKANVGVTQQERHYLMFGDR